MGEATPEAADSIRAIRELKLLRGKGSGPAPLFKLKEAESTVNNKFLNVLKRNPKKSGAVVLGAAGLVGFGAHKVVNED